MKLSDTEQKNIVRRSAAAISQLQDGEDAISVLSGIYCENLPDKSPRQGDLMARELLDWIDRFGQAWDGAMDGPEDYLCKAVAAPLSQLPLEEQCDFLARELGIENQQPASESLRDALLQETAKRLLAGEDFLGTNPGAAENTAWETVPGRNTVKEIVGEEMALAITAMVIYTMAKNGELSEVPKKISLAQVVIGVCAEDKLAELQWNAAKGYLETTLVENRLWVLKAACISTMLAAELIVGTGGWLMGMPLAAVAALCGYTLLWLGVVLGIYYKVNADMIREEAEQISYMEVEAYPVEVIETGNGQRVQKNLPWPERKGQKTEQKAKVRPKVYLGS